MIIRVDRQSDPRVCVLRMGGEMDIAVIPQIKECVESALEGGCEHIVMDLSDVDYADSSALGLLVWLDRRLEPRGGRLALAGANRDVTRILELSGLMAVVPTMSATPNVDAALEGLELRGEPQVPLWRHEFDVPAVMESLSGTRRQVVGYLHDLDMSDAALFDLKVAVGEALANAVRHGSPGGSTDSVTISVSAFEDRVVIEVSDTGAGFDGNSACHDDVYASSGRGVLFMRALMDRVDFAPCNGGGTRVTLVKHLPATSVEG